jgi:hypothetical protein
VPHEGHIYKGANHGFHNDTTPRYDETAAKEAWQRTLDWFSKYLRAEPKTSGRAKTRHSPKLPNEGEGPLLRPRPAASVAFAAEFNISDLPLSSKCHGPANSVFPTSAGGPNNNYWGIS